jgi:hypothetical protein
VACQLYRVVCLNPHATYATEWLGYLGETGRVPIERIGEHFAEKLWRDTIVRIEIDPTIYPDKASVMAAEEAAIRAERPLYNIEHNMDNPLRIPPWEAERQAEERAAKAGRSLPQRVPAKSPRPPVRARRRGPGRLVRSWRWWRRTRPARLATVWLVLAVGLWIVSAPHAENVGTGAMAGAFGASLLVIPTIKSKKRRRRRRRH